MCTQIQAYSVTAWGVVMTYSNGLVSWLYEISGYWHAQSMIMRSHVAVCSASQVGEWW